jgi:hypothetical protein
MKIGTHTETITAKARSIPKNHRHFLDRRLPGIDTTVGREGFSGIVKGATKYRMHISPRRAMESGIRCTRQNFEA